MTPQNSHNLIKGLEKLSVGQGWGCVRQGGFGWGHAGEAAVGLARHSQVERALPLAWKAGGVDLCGSGMAVGPANVRGLTLGERSHFHHSDEHAPCSSTPSPPFLHLLFF